MAGTGNMDPRSLSTEEFVGLLDAADAPMDPQAFAQLIKYASAEQLDAVLDHPRRRDALFDRIFSQMENQFRPGNAPDRDSAIHWRITGGPNGDDVYETWISGSQGPSAPQCTTSKKPSHDPRVTLTMSGDQFLALVSGNSSPTMMLITGKVTLEGDIGFAATLPHIFDIPEP